jgi:hypothetical protein
VVCRIGRCQPVMVSCNIGGFVDACPSGERPGSSGDGFSGSSMDELTSWPVSVFVNHKPLSKYRPTRDKNTDLRGIKYRPTRDKSTDLRRINCRLIPTHEGQSTDPRGITAPYKDHLYRLFGNPVRVPVCLTEFIYLFVNKGMIHG